MTDIEKLKAENTKLKIQNHVLTELHKNRGKLIKGGEQFIVASAAEEFTVDDDGNVGLPGGRSMDSWLDGMRYREPFLFQGQDDSTGEVQAPSGDIGGTVDQRRAAIAKRYNLA